MNTKKAITPKDFFAQFNGKLFPNDGEFELAVLQAFNKVSQWFPEKTYRDLVEFAKENNWISRSGYEVSVSVPKSESDLARATKLEVSNTPKKLNDLLAKQVAMLKDMATPKELSSENTGLSFSEIYWLVELNSARGKKMRPNGITDFGFDTLIQRGLVEYVDLNSHTTEMNRALIEEGKSNLLILFKNVNSYESLSQCVHQFDQLQDTISESAPDMVYRFTEAGEKLIQSMGNPTSGIENS